MVLRCRPGLTPAVAAAIYLALTSSLEKASAVIEFHLDARSGVPTYLQLVQQVRQAVRLGVLPPGRPAADREGGRRQPRDQPEHGAEGVPRARPRGARRGAARASGRSSRADAAAAAARRCQALRARSALGRAGARGRARRRGHRGAVRATRVRRRRSRGSHERRRARAPHGLGKRYGSTWALRDCSLEIPAGSVTALVGPNGAGKTTLLQLAVGLAPPSAGDVRVLGLSPRDDAAAVLPRLGFVAQEHPLYRGFTIAETLELGRRLNPGWDDALARRPGSSGSGCRSKQKVGKLSGGQQAQVALTLALAKRPELLLLDEPVASLDPLARREFLRAVMEAVAETGMTVMLSSHIVADLERVCDHLVILRRAAHAARGPIDEIVREPPAADRPARRRRGGRARARRDPREPHRAADDAPRPRERPRVRRALGAPRGRPRGHRPRLPRPGRGGARPRPERRCSVTWLGWRQQRTETLIAGGDARSSLAAAAAPDRAPDGLRVPPRRPRRLPRRLGHGLVRRGDQRLHDRFERLGNLVPWLTLLPGLIGVLFAAPFVARARERHVPARLDAEHHAPALDRGKLGLRSARRLVAAVALTLFLTWWRTPFVHLQGRMDSRDLRLEGTVVTATRSSRSGSRSRSASLWRRAVPALVVAFFAYFAARLFVDMWLRQRLVAPDSATWKMTGPQPANFRNAWVLNAFPSDRLGNPARPFFGCVSATRGNAKLLDPSCLAAHGAGFTHAVYEPASRFWLLQGLETSLFAGVALALIALAAWWTHERVA